jgi:hypothetical protein
MNVEMFYKRLEFLLGFLFFWTVSIVWCFKAQRFGNLFPSLANDGNRSSFRNVEFFLENQTMNKDQYTIVRDFEGNFLATRALAEIWGRFWSSGLWRHIVLCVVTSVSEERRHNRQNSTWSNQFFGMEGDGSVYHHGQKWLLFRSPCSFHSLTGAYSLEWTQPPVQWVPRVLSLGQTAAGAWLWPLTPF